MSDRLKEYFRVEHNLTVVKKDKTEAWNGFSKVNCYNTVLG